MKKQSDAKICEQCNDVFALYMFRTKKDGTTLPICNKCLRKNKRKQYANYNPKKAGSHAIVKIALKSGHLVRKPCEKCGNPKTDAHHPDYEKPLDIIWLCHLHHMQLHHKHD